MSLAATVKAMAAAGMSADQIADVVARMEEDRLSKARAGNARRQASYRRRHQHDSNESNANNGVMPVTSVTEPSSLLPSPIPPTNNSSPQPSLRSDLVRLREQFDRFMAVFPKRENHKAAWAKFQVAAKAGVDPERIIIAAGRYAEHKQFTEPQFIKAPDAWLNAGKYDDELPNEPPKPQARAGPRSQGDGMTVVLQKLREQVNGQSSSGIKDIGPAGISEPGTGNAGSRIPEPTGRSSRGGEILDFRPASPDARRSPAPHSEAARAVDWPDPTWEYR